MTDVKLVKALGTVLLLLVGTYAPAFLTVALLKLPLLGAIPVVIVISLAAGLLFIYFMYVMPGRAGFADFGFRICRYRYVAAAIVLGAPIGWALTALVSRLTSGRPSPEMTLRPWLTIVYFVIGAAIQEEAIFRGLLQTTLAQQFPATFSLFGSSFFVRRDSHCPFVWADPHEGQSDYGRGGLRTRTIGGGTETPKR